MIRVPRLRFTVRRIMVAVAVIACLIAVGMETARTIRRVRSYKVLIARHAQRETAWGASLRTYRNEIREGERTVARLRRLQERGEFLTDESLWVGWANVIETARTRARHSAHLAGWHAEQRRLYERAVVFPWRPVSPGPYLDVIEP